MAATAQSALATWNASAASSTSFRSFRSAAHAADAAAASVAPALARAWRAAIARLHAPRTWPLMTRAGGGVTASAERASSG